MPEKVELRCTNCGHEWEGKPLDDRKSMARCSSCDAVGDVIESPGEGDDDREQREDSDWAVSQDPPEESAGGGAMPSRPEPTDTDADDRLAPPQPEEFADTDSVTESDSESGVSPRDVYERIIEMYPGYGQNTSKENVVEYLTEKADYFGTPSPDELEQWLMQYPNIGQDAPRNVRMQFDEALTHQMQRGALGAAAVRELFVPGNLQGDEQSQGQAAPQAPSSAKTAAASYANPGVDAGQPGIQPGASTAKEMAMGAAGSNGVPQAIDEHIEQADASQAVKRHARQMVAEGRPPEMPPGAADNGAADQQVRELSRAVELLEETHRQLQEQSAAADDPGYDFTEFLDDLNQVESQLDELRGDDDTPDEYLQQLNKRIDALAEQVGRGMEPTGGTEDDFLSIIANADDIPTNEKAELLSQVGGAASDPEVQREKYRLKKTETWANALGEAVQNAAEGIASGDSEESASLAYNVGSFLRGLRGGGQQPQQQPAARQPRQAQPARQAQAPQQSQQAQPVNQQPHHQQPQAAQGQQAQPAQAARPPQQPANQQQQADAAAQETPQQPAAAEQQSGARESGRAPGPEEPARRAGPAESTEVESPLSQLEEPEAESAEADGDDEDDRVIEAVEPVDEEADSAEGD